MNSGKKLILKDLTEISVFVGFSSNVSVLLCVFKQNPLFIFFHTEEPNEKEWLIHPPAITFCHNISSQKFVW